MRRSSEASHSRMEGKTEEMETWPQSVRDIQEFLGFRGLIGDSIESKRHSPRCFEQLTHQLAISPRAPRPRSRMHLVVLVVLVVLMELMEVTKICQVLGS